ncbi:MAG: flagellar biosynthetic protein FliR [Deltaproteobacteria bacterium]|jgi:flagellar biosynthetic protein FliR|nr:flagellar biosynthetic protein FliR [Deltaproteobacteria bacterium]
MQVDMLQWSLAQFQSFLLILMRVAPILFLMPLLGSRNIPTLAKIGLALTVSLILLSSVKMESSIFPQEPLSFLAFLGAELFVGFLLGLAVKIIFAGIQMGGELVGFQMGLSIAQVIDPQSGTDSSALAEFHYFLGTLIFLAVDGHHWFFRALVQSFQVLVPGEIHLRAGLFTAFTTLTGNLFVIAIKLSAPVMTVLLFTQISMGILAKAVPQVNILITSFPITILVGLVFLGFSLDFFLPYFRSLFEETGRELTGTLLPLMQR